MLGRANQLLLVVGWMLIVHGLDQRINYNFIWISNNFVDP